MVVDTCRLNVADRFANSAYTRERAMSEFPLGRDCCDGSFPRGEGVKQDEETDELITAQEAMTLLGVSRNTLYTLAKRGELPGRKVGRRWRFHRAELMRSFATASRGRRKR